VNKEQIHNLIKGQYPDEEIVLPQGYVKSSFMVVSEKPLKDEDWLKVLLDKVNIDTYTTWKTSVSKNGADVDDISELVDHVIENEIVNVQPQIIFTIGEKVSKAFKKLDGTVLFVELTEDLDDDELDDRKNEIRQIVFRSTFINFHHHNQFSFRDGLGTEDQIVQRLMKLKMPGFCLTNHGNMNAHFRLYNAAKAYGIKPIYGNEMYYCPNIQEINKLKLSKEKEDVAKRVELSKESYHLTVLAKNETGYYNLIKMSNISWIENFYKFPRIDDELLEKHKEGLIVLSGCIGGFIPKNLINDNEEAAYEKARLYKDWFGDDFYIELHSTDYEPQKEANEKLVKLAKDLDIKTVIASDTHYINKGDDEIQQIMMLNNAKQSIEDLNDPTTKTWSFSVKDLYIKSIDALMSDFDDKMKNVNYDEKDFVTSILNVNELFTRIEHFDIDNSLKLPNMGENSSGEFRKLLKEGIEYRKLEVTEKLLDRLKIEMDIIEKLGYVDYFLIMADIIVWTKDKFGEYSVGPGRGSAAGSLVNFLLKITDVNPLNHEMLLFERFLSPGRADVPDIDTDFSPDIRPLVKEYIVERFGREYVCSIGNYQTLKLKSAMQDVFRTLNIPFGEVVLATKEIGNLSPDDEILPVADIRKDYKMLDDLLRRYPETERFIDSLKGLVKSTGQHAAGVIVSSKKLTENIPLVITSSKEIVSANTEGGDNHELTALGYIKYDILSLTTLKLINDCSKYILERHGVDLDWNEKEYDDERMYELLHKGDTYGVFQFSSPLATKYLESMKPDDLNDLCAASALLRPGPLDQKMHEEYSLIKSGEKDYSINEALKDILGPTFGIIVYQEQILRICQELGGFTKTEANVFRKALVKYEKSPEHEKKRRERVKSFSVKLIEGLEKYMSSNEATKLWEIIESFARYGFNYAHSLSYSILSHRQLYQKFFYPMEYYCSFLNNEELSAYARIIRKMTKFELRKFDYDDMSITETFNANIAKPNFSLMNSDFIIDGDEIVHGITKIKFITQKAFDILKDNYDIIDLENIDLLLGKKYLNHLGKNAYLINKRIFAALVFSGALDYLDMSRNDIIDRYNDIRKMKDKAAVPHIENKSDRTAKEKDYLGYSMDGNREFRAFRDEYYAALPGTANLDEIFDEEHMSQASDIFRISKVTMKKTKNDKDYRLVELDTIDRAFYPVFVWKKEIDLKKGSLYIGDLAKSNGFITLENVELINE
jgi:DNA polymerase-3 subunit alpha